MKIFLTEYYGVLGSKFCMIGGRVYANDWAHAERIVKQRGKGEVVVGELIKEIPCDTEV